MMTTQSIPSNLQNDLKEIIKRFDRFPATDVRAMTVREIPALFRTDEYGGWIASSDEDAAFALMIRLSAVSFAPYSDSSPYPMLCALAGWALHAAFPRPGYLGCDGYEQDPRLIDALEKTTTP